MIFNTAKPKLKHYNIPPTDENHELLRKAKTAIAASHPEQALELLATLKLKTLDIEITALSARLTDLERTNRLGTVSYEAKTLEQNKINESLTLLITALEKEIAQSFEFYDKIRVALKSRYETRLSQKLSNRQPVNLRLVPSTAGTTPQAANTFVQYSEGQIRGKLAEYYQDAHGRLLLVGVPGAGKTTLLLQLELELLEQEIARIPVILNLARWSSTFPILEDWIQEILPSEMGLTINKKVAGDLVAQNRLILLLDGLDEVKAEDRKTCLEAIGLYGEDPKRLFIISSRIDEYNAVAKDAPVNGQVEVGTLTYEQLIEQLEKTGQNEGSKRLLAALKEDVTLREIAEIPFYFNILQLLFARGKYLHEFNFSALDTDGRKKEIERSYVFEMFRKISIKGYDNQLIRKYLGFFASRLKRENLVDFELINLQYSWYKFSKQEAEIVPLIEVFVNRLVEILVGILVVVLVSTLIGALLGTQAASTIILPSMILYVILAKNEEKSWIKNKPIIETRERIMWNWQKYINIKYLIFIIFFSLAFILLFGLSGALLFGMVAAFKGLFGGLFGGITVGLFYGLVVGFIFVLILVPSSLFYGQLENHNSFLQINDPYQRFRASAKVFYFSILQHWHLRHLLYKKGLLPKKIVPFLNDMVACNILETTGASWRFRHRILQDYFDDQWVETEFEPEQK